MTCAGRFGVAVERFQDLAVWQLSRELERRVFAFTAILPASRDFDFCRQARRSSLSAARNIAEGFGRFWPAEFAGSFASLVDHWRRRKITSMRHSSVVTFQNPNARNSLRWGIGQWAPPRALPNIWTKLPRPGLRSAGDFGSGVRTLNTNQNREP
jgi:hypothetical protein